MASNFVDDERFDGLYLNVAQTTRGIEPLLDTVFSFLRRKTDFFAGPPGAANGTEAAIAKVNEVMSKHANKYKSDKEKSSAKKSKKKTKPVVVVQKKKQDEEVIELGQGGEFDVSSSKDNTATASTATDNATKAVPKKQATPKESTPAPTVTTPPPTETPASTEKKPATTATQPDDNKEEDSTTIIGNGTTVPGRYTWTQTLSELSVNMSVPENTRGRDLNVTIDRNHIKASLRSANNKTFLINAPLTKTIICDDSFWTVEDGNRLSINLQKLNQMEWWNSVCQDDAVKVDITKIQPESSKLNDLDGDTRKTVEKMMYDQRQKAMGLPSSDEEVKLSALERFKKQHPEMDFSNAKMS